MSSIRSMRDYDERTQHLKHLWHETVIKRLLDNAEHLEGRVGALRHDMKLENLDVRHAYARTFEFDKILADIRRLLLETEIFQDKEIFLEGFLKEAAEAERLAAAIRRTRPRKAGGRAAKPQKPARKKLTKARASA
ncbi:MAG: hypothetical protein FD148_81 [Methylocystaceae bacterium]|nr:MAG: hypothetical protein FD148_81 [Methylocystaceae bacterium]